MKWLIVILLTIVSGILYRLGGWEKGNTKIRDLGCPSVTLLTIFLLGLYGNLAITTLSYFITFLFMFGALTTYWDFVPFNKGKDNFYMHGFFVGLSTIPCMLLGIHLYSVLIYSVSLAVLMGLWCKLWTNDIVEEVGRGALIILTLPLLLL